MDPKVIEQILKMQVDILKSQKDMLAQSEEKKNNKNIANEDNSEETKSMQIYSKLQNLITEFQADIQKGITFESWYNKNKSFFEFEGKSLTENVKVRLLVSKLGVNEYTKMSQKMMPQSLESMKFDDLVKQLHKEYSDPRSKLVKRFEVMKLRCPCVEKIMDFGTLLNSECEKAQMALSVEESKILLFISGMPEEAYDLRQISLKFVENYKKSEECTLKALIKTPIQVNNKSNSNQQNGYNQYYKRDQFQYNQNKFNRNQMNQHYNQTKSNNDCEQCGKTGHNIDNCWWNPDNDLEPPKCDNCGGLGHFSSKCRKSKGQFNRFNRPQINHITTDSGPYCCIADIVDPKGIIMCKEKWIIESVKINNKEVKMIVDSASQITCISEEVWKELGSPEMMPVNYNGVGLGKTNFNIEGKIKANIELFNKKSEEEIHIVKGEGGLH
uniref:CCHC-type domain-containing protein n=1 Tax=Meloidogyne hapla TaxID=6305 RepID=A0A1I8B6X4_MELHA